MSKSIANIIKEWNTLSVTKKPKRINKSELSQLIKNEPNSLKAKLALNPYANILSSPLRRCSFYSRFFPSKFLLRFGIAWHPETNLNWAYPTLSKKEGFGYYVKLQKKLLDKIQKGGHQAVFRGSATYRSDMNQHISDLISKESWKEFNQHSLDSFDIILATKEEKKWKGLDKGYHCILTIDQSDVLYQLDHQVDGQEHIPCYHLNQIWSPDMIEDLKSKLNIPNPTFTIGVPKRLDTLKLATDFWRYLVVYNQ